MNRNKTIFRHVKSDGSLINVTESDGKYYIGNTDKEAKGKMMKCNKVDRHPNRRYLNK